MKILKKNKINIFLRVGIKRLSIKNSVSRKSPESLACVTEKTNRRPIVKQSTDIPITIGKGVGEIVCANDKCKNLLVKNYSDNIVDINFRCFKCKNLTGSRNLYKNEILPKSTIALADGKEFSITSLESSWGVAWASESAIKESQKHFAKIGLGYSAISQTNWLENVIGYFSENMKDELESATRIVLESDKHGNYEEPGKKSLGWAIIRARQLRDLSRPIGISRNDCIKGIKMLHLAWFLLNSWRNHPFYNRINYEFFDDYHHTATMLLFALYFQGSGEHKNHLTFTDTDAIHNSGHSPDIFLKLNSEEEFSIEVKSPLLFRSQEKNISCEEIESCIISQSKTAKKQIIANLDGVLVIGSLFSSTDFFDSLISSCKKLCDKGNSVSSKIVLVFLVYFDVRVEGEVNEDLFFEFVEKYDKFFNKNYHKKLDVEFIQL